MNDPHRRWIGVVVLATAVALSFYAGRISAPRAAKVSIGANETVHASLPANPQAAAVSKPSIAPHSWEEPWKALLAKPGSPARDEQILAAIRELARQDPQRAIALALGQTHLRLRQQALHAALSGWGEVAPDAAADWVFASDQSTLDKVDAVSSVLRSLAKTSAEDAMTLTTRLLEKNPDRAQQLGIAFISILGANGQFAQATEFAAKAKSEDQPDWMTGAYSYWAEYQPENAVAAATALADPGQKALALSAVISKWAYNNPRAVIERASAFPPEQRAQALTEALRNWAAENPGEAAEWLNRADSHLELDSGIASVATSWQFTQKPDVALGWAESIVDVGLRSSTIAEVVRQWAIADRNAALRYVESSPHIHAEEKQVLMSELKRGQE